MKSRKTTGPKKTKKKKTNKPFGRRFPERASGSAAVLAANLWRLRKERELSQADVARALGVDQAAIGLIELGRANPTLRTIAAIAEVLQTTAGDLLNGRKRARPKR
jgi:DNA-binding XRE family transcriptional regulator